MHDLVIIGAGPAGLSAALTAHARNLRVLVVSNKAAESPLAKAKRIDNYPGMPEVSGLRLLEAMTAQALALGIELVHERVITILPMDGYFALTSGNDVFEAKAVILAIGTQAAKPLPGEAEYLGRGVSYCATCDGMLYRGKHVVVFGLNSEAVSEANFLSDIGCDVTFISPGFPEGLEASIDARIGRLTAVSGDVLGVSAVSYRALQGVATASGGGSGVSIGNADSGASGFSPSEIECQGVFILRPMIAPDALVNGIQLDDGLIAVKAGLATSIPGIFAAGDCIGKPFQVTKAAGEGTVAALSAAEYLA